MHIAEGVLSPAQCAVWYAAAAPFVVHGGYRVVKEVKEHPENKLLLATAGAFTFVLSAIKLPSVTGSSSHPTGTGVGAALFKPPVMAFLGMIVLIFQALLLAQEVHIKCLKVSPAQLDSLDDVDHQLLMQRLNLAILDFWQEAC